MWFITDTNFMAALLVFNGDTTIAAIPSPISVIITF